MKRLLFSLAAMLLPAVSISAQQTITFDDATCSECPIPAGYAGLNWSNMYFLNAVTYSGNPSGYLNGMVSPNFVAYNAFGTGASVLQGATPFTLNSGYFTGAWNDGLTLAVTGFSGGISTYFATFTLNTSGPLLAMFNWTNLNEVQFVSSGGTSHGYVGSGTQFALDNLVIDSVVPEPASMTLLGTGLVGVLGIVRRRRHSVANDA